MADAAEVEYYQLRTAQAEADRDIAREKVAELAFDLREMDVRLTTTMQRCEYWEVLANDRRVRISELEERQYHVDEINDALREKLARVGDVATKLRHLVATASGLVVAVKDQDQNQVFRIVEVFEDLLQAYDNAIMEMTT